MMFESFIKNIAEENTDKEIKELLINDKKVKQQIIELINRIKDGEPKETIIVELKEYCQHEKVCDAVIQIINSNVEPFENLTFLRELNFHDFERIIGYMVKNTLVNTELKSVVIKETGLDDCQFSYAMRLLHTANECVIVKRYTINHFKKTIYDLFRFDNKQIEYLWEVFNQNVQQLTKAIILDNILLCRQIDDNISNLLNIFSEFPEEDE